MSEVQEMQLNDWELRVAGIDFYKIPDGAGYSTFNFDGMYNRIVGTVKGYIKSLWTNAQTGIPAIDDYTNPIEVSFESGKLNKNWWDHAIMTGKGKEPRTDLLPTLNNPNDAYHIDTVESTLFPAYRALKESFERRSFLQWIFNHAQYTAERDAYRAIRGTVMTLLNQTRDEFDTRYKAYCDDVESQLTPQQIKETVRQQRAEAKEEAKREKANAKKERHKESDSPSIRPQYDTKNSVSGDEDYIENNANNKEQMRFSSEFNDSVDEKSEAIETIEAQERNRNF